MPLRDKLIKIRATSEEVAILKRDAASYGYEPASYVRLRIFGRWEGQRVIRKPSVDTNLLGDALGQLGDATRELNKVGSNLNQIAKRLNQGNRDLFLLDSSLRWFERICGNIIKALTLIEKAISGHPHKKED